MYPPVEEFHKTIVNGKVVDENLDERIALEEVGDAKDAYEAIYSPLTALTEIPVDERKTGNGGSYDSNNLRYVPEVEDLAEAYEENIDKTDVFFYFSLDDGTYEFEAVPRTDFDPRDRVRPPSFIELIHQPDRHRSTENSDRQQMLRMSLRYAMDFKDDFLDEAGMDTENYVNEIDLLTAFYREGGLHDQLADSSIEFSPVVREDLRILQSDSDSVVDHMADETVPYVSQYLTDDFQDGGYSEDERLEAARHIGTTNALGISFSREREMGELFGMFSEGFGRSLVNIDPEGAVYVPEDEAELDRDRQLFVQRTPPNDGISHHRIEELADDLIDRAEDSSKDWRSVLGEELPEKWREEMPEAKFL